MATQNAHGKLIAAAAKAALLPLGFRRRGQSRCWYSDERFWCIFVEFQPSAWSKGTYTNVSPIWLFLQHGSGSVHRVADYIQFESIEQFSPLIEQMAKLAAEEAVALRNKFRTPWHVHHHFASLVAGENMERIYGTAVTAGLVGEFDLARQLFARVAAVDTANRGPWISNLQEECSHLSRLLEDPLQYRSTILHTISMRRQKRGLPPDPGCLDSLDLA
jgi:hypothetical protein